MLKRIIARYREAYSGLPRDAWALSLVMFIDMSGTMVIFFLSIYLTGRPGFSIFQSGQVLSGYGVGMLFGAFVGGMASDRIGPLATQRLCLFGAGLTLFALGAARGFSANLHVPRETVRGHERRNDEDIFFLEKLNRLVAEGVGVFDAVDAGEGGIADGFFGDRVGGDPKAVAIGFPDDRGHFFDG